MDEYKAEVMPHVVSLFIRMYDIMGNNMFSHLSKFKEVRELIAKWIPLSRINKQISMIIDFFDIIQIYLYFIQQLLPWRISL